MIAVQSSFVTGYYRCQNCDRDVSRVRKMRRFRLCDDCWTAIMVPDDLAPGSPEQIKAGSLFWTWYWEMERRYPVKLSWRVKPVSPAARSVDSYYPLCECGRPRKPLGHGPRGVFGGPFMRHCAVCDAKLSVESFVALAGKLYPDRDDEEWLDVLYQSHREAFDVGVLPDYWFEMRRGHGI